jgi:RNA polymerase sigma-70 factor, ECF subfamily
MRKHDLDDLLREQIPALRRYACWLTRDISSADDLVQSSLEKALSRWSTRQVDGELRPWLFSIVYHGFIDSCRRARRYQRFLELFRGDEPTQPSLEREYVAGATLSAFERLPEEQRNLLYWVSIEGLSYKEIATMLNVPIGTVMSRLSRARDALRKLAEGTHSPKPALRVLK